MPLIRCTAQLLKEVGINGTDLSGEESPCPGLGTWYANLLMIDRRKSILFTNEKTLYSFLVTGVKKKDFEQFDRLFLSNLSLNLEYEGFREDVVEKVVGEYDRVVLGKTRDRSILGSMNDYAYQYKFYIKRGGGLSSCDILSLNKEINRTPLRPVGYKNGIEGLRYLLGDRRIMDQDLRRIEYRRGMLDPGMSPRNLPVKVWDAPDIPAEVSRAIKDEDILNIAGVYGDRYAGDPMEYEHLKVVLTEDSVEVEFFNRAITLFTTDDERFRRIHRVICTLLDAKGARIIGPASLKGHNMGSNKIGRNAPCPCGSGKKYKKCCLYGPSGTA